MKLPDRRTGLSLAFAVLTLVAAGCQRKERDVPVVIATATPAGTSATDTPTPSSTASATSTPSPTPSPTIPAASAMTTFSIDGAAGSVTLSSSGYGGALMYPGSNATGVSGAYTLSTTPSGTIPSPAPVGNAFLYFTMQLSNSVTFSGNFATTPVTLPASFATSGQTYVETFYDQTTGAPIGTPVTGIVNGQTITFGSVTNGTFAATAGDVYLFVISSN